MRVLVTGGGGREHAIVLKLKQSSLVDEIFCAPGNGGIRQIAECFPVSAENVREQISLAKRLGIDLVIVGPEIPLAEGIVNALRAEGILAFGPTKEAAQIESSKVFAKELMHRRGIPTASCKIFTRQQRKDAYNYVRRFSDCTYPHVIKVSGLAAGKGVFIVQNEKEACQTLDMIIKEQVLGKAGDEIIIEHYLQGEEVSMMVFTDGKHFLPLLPSQDHKKLLDGDKGPNTGGMGAYAPVPFLTDTDIGNIIEKNFAPVVHGLKKKGIKYQGLLYGGLILTEGGPKVLEFNCRFGDPETQPILALLNSDIMEPILATIKGGLDKISLRWKRCHATCVVLASSGYPEKYEKGKEIFGLDTKLSHIKVLHAGTKYDNPDGYYAHYTNGGRVLGITAIGVDLKQSIDLAYEQVGKVKFDKMVYRKDIGQRGLAYINKKKIC